MPTIVEMATSAVSVTVVPLYKSTPRFTRDAKASQSAVVAMVMMPGL